MRNRCGVHVSNWERGGKSYFCNRPNGHKGDHAEFPDEQGVQYSESLTALQKKIARVKDQLSSLLQKELDEKPKSANVVCVGWTVGSGDGCGTLLPVGDLTYIQTHWYTSPYGCTGGDYWNEGEGQFVCPKCGALNRLYERPKVEALKHSFKNIENKYRD